MVSGGCHQRHGSNAVEVVDLGAVGPISRPWLLEQGRGSDAYPTGTTNAGKALGSAKTHTTTARARRSDLIYQPPILLSDRHMRWKRSGKMS